MSITKYLNLSHLRKLLSALGQRFYAIEQRQDSFEQRQDNFDTQIRNINVETDTTLSVSGKPADAAAVGSEFSNLSDTAYSGNISSLDNITNLDQYVLYSSMGYFSFNGQAINNLFIPTNASVNGFPLFVPYGTYLYDTSIYYRIYWKNSPNSAIATYRGIYVDGSFVGAVVSGVYLAKVTDSKLYLYTLLTMNNASSTVPSMDGTASAGSSTKYARADHVHPRDTTKANVSQVLTLTNTTAYTPTATYHPATKGYVDGLIPTKVSDLNNDSGFQTQAQVESAIVQNAEIVVVNLTSTTTDGVTTYTADKTHAELYAAYAAGKTLILFKRISSTAGSYFHLLSCSSGVIIFCQVDATFGYNCFKIKNNNTIVKETYTNVRTVNGKYNDVTLTYSDVGALPDSTVIPTKVSDLNNDSGFQTQTQVESAINSARTMVVHITWDSTNSKYVSDKTFAEIYNAFNNDTNIIAILDLAVYHLITCYYYSEYGEGSAQFCSDAIYNADGRVYVEGLCIDIRVKNENLEEITTIGVDTANIFIPTKVSDLNNDSGFQTQAQVNALIAAAGDDDTTYAISISGNVITLTGSDGNTSTVTLPVYTGGVV